MKKGVSDLALQTAAQAWCTETTSGITMDPVLCEAFAEILDRWIEKSQNTRPAAAVDELIEAVRKANGLLDELIRLGKEGMEPDYTRWITFHDKVAELASEARAALTGRGE